MPELNNDVSDAAPSDAAPPDTAVSNTAWPELVVSGGDTSDAGVGDPAVLAILERVGEVPGLPVSEHPAAYAGLHDALLEALNEEPQNDGPQPGRGAA